MPAQPSYKRSASVVTWLVTLLVARVAGKEGGGGFMRDTITRFMGLIVLSMGMAHRRHRATVQDVRLQS